MRITRRIFLRNGALAVAGTAAIPSFLTRAAYGALESGNRAKRLVVIFQRGAADGLNIVVPHGEQAYYSMRPSINIPRSSVLDLDGFFGLHPALSPLQPIWNQRHLAIVHAAGSPDPTRSHFDAQDFMESGTPGRKATNDGWLNRALPPVIEGRPSPVRAVSLGAQLSRSLRGRNDAVAINNLNSFQVSDPREAATFESMYTNTPDKFLNGTGRETFEAVKLMQSIQKQSYTPANGARYPNGRLGQSMTQIAR